MVALYLRTFVLVAGLERCAGLTSANTPVAIERLDVAYTLMHREEKMGERCTGHFTYAGPKTVQECAMKCLETYGCVRFSVNDAEGESTPGTCYVSTGTKAHHKTDADHSDSQCEIGVIESEDSEDSHNSIVYEVVFYHGVPAAGVCDQDNYPTHSMTVHDANTTEQCAHACKNMAGCARFTAWPNAQECRISNSTVGEPAVPTATTSAFDSLVRAGYCPLHHGGGGPSYVGTVYELNVKR